MIIRRSNDRIRSFPARRGRASGPGGPSNVDQILAAQVNVKIALAECGLEVAAGGAAGQHPVVRLQVDDVHVVEPAQVAGEQVALEPLDVDLRSAACGGDGRDRLIDGDDRATFFRAFGLDRPGVLGRQHGDETRLAPTAASSTEAPGRPETLRRASAAFSGSGSIATTAARGNCVLDQTDAAPMLKARIDNDGNRAGGKHALISPPDPCRDVGGQVIFQVPEHLPERRKVALARPEGDPLTAAERERLQRRA